MLSAVNNSTTRRLNDTDMASHRAFEEPQRGSCVRSYAEPPRFRWYNWLVTGVTHRQRPSSVGDKMPEKMLRLNKIYALRYWAFDADLKERQ